MDLIWKDIRYALHSLRANAGFALVSILTLALGIGATTAIFSVVNAVMLRPLPLHDADRLVMVWERSRGGNDRNYVSPANLVEWMKEKGTIFESIGASFDWKLSMTGHGEAEEVRVGLASRTYFPTLGARAHLGRVLLPEDADRDVRSAVLSYAMWQRKFGGDPNVLGKIVRIDGSPHAIVGVMPREFFTPESRADLWVPYRIPINEGANRGRFLHPVARLAPGVTLEQAQARMDLVGRRTEAAFPRYNAGYGVNVLPLHEQIVGKVRRSLLIVLAAVGFLLLIACVNVANLLLSRAAGRSKEMAVRAALGASRRRLVAQLLTESIVLALISAAVGIVIAGWATMLLVRFTPEAVMMPRLTEISVDGRALLVTVLIAIVTAILFGLAPAIEASRANLQTGLKSSSRGSTHHRRGTMFRNALVVAEVALATVLLISAGLMIRSFAKLQAVDSGVKPDGVLTMHIVLPATYDNPEKMSAIVTQMQDRVRMVPGVTRVGVINNLPFTNWISNSGFFIDSDPKPKVGEEPSADFRAVTGDYFRTTGIPLLAGRVFTDRDTAKAPTVFVINDVLARRYFKGRNPVGQRLTFEWWNMVHGEIVGVVGSDRAAGLDKEAAAALYRVYYQEPEPAFSLVIGASADPMSLQTPVKRAIRELDPLIPVSDVKTLEQLVSSTIARPRFNTTILTIFAVLGLILASIGIYGVLSYSVTQRTQEMGIRMALGAAPRSVLQLVVRNGLTLALIGVGLGVLIAAGATRVLAALLYGVEATDPAVFAAVAAALIAVAVAASYVPARRATRVDPMIALQPE